MIDAQQAKAPLKDLPCLCIVHTLIPEGPSTQHLDTWVLGHRNYVTGFGASI